MVKDREATALATLTTVPRIETGSAMAVESALSLVRVPREVRGGREVKVGRAVAGT